MSLDEETELAGISLPNRAVFRPVRTRFVDEGTPTDDLGHHLAARIAGGVGLVIGPAQMLVHPSASGPGYVDAYDSSTIPGLQQVTREVHGEGGKVFGQLTHPGAEETGDWEMQPQLAPSASASDATHEMPKSVGGSEIQEIQDGFVQAAQNLEEAGFDGVELNAGPFSLLRQFLSPRYNTRTDQYGGDIESRARFVNETVSAVADSVGVPVGLHLSLAELEHGGYEFDDAQNIVDALDLPQYLSCTLGTRATYTMTHAGATAEAPPLIPAIDNISNSTSVPIVGRAPLTTLENADEILEAGADVVSFTRQLLADPETLTKDTAETINRCIQCNQKCLEGVYGHAHGGHVECVVQPRTGREATLPALSEVSTAETPRRILVVGGGPAGIRFATVASRRGHDVVLREANEELGGQLPIAATGPLQSFKKATEDLIESVRSTDVTIETNTPVSPEDVDSTWDVVVVATGATEGEPPDSFGSEVLGAQEILSGTSVSNDVIVVDDNRWVITMQVGYELASRGCDVEMISSDHYPGFRTEQPNLPGFVGALQSMGVTFTGDHDVTAISDDGIVHLRNVLTGNTEMREPEDVVYAGRRKAEESLYHNLADTHDNVYRIGDSVSPRKLDRAYYDAELLARRL